MCTKKNTFKGEFSYIFWDLEEGGFFQGFEKIHALFLGIKGPLTCPGGGGGLTNKECSTIQFRPCII